MSDYSRLWEQSPALLFKRRAIHRRASADGSDMQLVLRSPALAILRRVHVDVIDPRGRRRQATVQLTLMARVLCEDMLSGSIHMFDWRADFPQGSELYVRVDGVEPHDVVRAHALITEAIETGYGRL